MNYNKFGKRVYKNFISVEPPIDYDYESLQSLSAGVFYHCALKHVLLAIRCLDDPETNEIQISTNVWISSDDLLHTQVYQSGKVIFQNRSWNRKFWLEPINRQAVAQLICDIRQKLAVEILADPEFHD